MQNLLENILSNLGIKDYQPKEEDLQIASLMIISATYAKMTREEKMQIQEFLDSLQFEKILEITKSKHSPAEWDVFVEEVLTPTLAKYFSSKKS